MCGISIALSSSGERVSEKDIRCMTDSVLHRGPAGDGFYHYKNVALGHRRLAIIDVSPAGSQPMHWQDDLVIVFNGEIYNYIELRQQLAHKHGYHFTTQTDTEVILAAYHCWGPACQQHFNGMWAFAILDKRKDILFCSRDRFGVKPFYYTRTGAGFYAGSEIKQLLPFLSTRKVAPAALADYLLLNLSDHSEETFFENILQLRGGHQLLYQLSENRFVISQWYSLSYHQTINGFSETAFLETFETEMQRSVQWRMRSDVRVGTCLSGGLDSSCIAALSATEHRKSSSAEAFNAITAQSIEKRTDETAFARLVAEQYRLNWHITTPTASDFHAVVDNVITVQEEPFADLSVYMQYFVMQEAKKRGITVLLDGQGADECLLGYSRYIFQPMQEQGMVQKLAQLSRIHKTYGLGIKETLLQAFYYNNQQWRLQQRRSRLKHLHKAIAGACRSNQYLVQTTTLRQLQQHEMLTASLPLLLRFEDKNAMHFSIETRLPFLDWKLVETVYSMNDSLRFSGGWSKYILRKSNEKRLPPEIAWRRKKLGFAAPAMHWIPETAGMEGAIKASPFLQELFNNRIPSAHNRQMLWKLYNLQRWAHLFNVNL